MSETIKYTRHAKNRMRWRRISQQEVEDCIANPDVTEASTTGRINAWRAVDQGYVRVTFRDNDEILVITVVRKRNGPGG